VESPVADKGMTSYFALDITDPDPDNWTLLWEFSEPALGFTTTEPAIVRINSDADSDGNPEIDTNGHWYVVVASGPTGPIYQVAKQFMARSDQQLKIFVIDLRTGSHTTISTLGHQGTLSYAFGGNLLNSTVDPDEDYSDDALYFGYVYSDTGSGDTFNKGGVVRLLTKEDRNPSNWAASRLVHGIGPVTSSVAHLENTDTKELWTYFGEGRYFYVIDLGVNIDDGNNQRRVYGLKDPCYSVGAYNTACTTTLSVGGNITDVSTIQPVADAQDGWLVNLDPVGGASNHKAERVITNPVASETGAVFFVSFKPTANKCAFSGGDTYLWALAASSGGSIGTQEAKALVQVSTGSIEEQNIPVDLTDKEGRRSSAMTGVPPAGEGLSLILPPVAVREIMHIQEK
jgi:type IV pilus assembly protein PilY1